MELNGKTVLFLGDSITYGFGTSSLSEQYSDTVPPKVLAQLRKAFPARIAEATGCISLNYGFCGSRIARDTVTPSEQQETVSFVDRVSDMEEHADLIVVLGGVNDYLADTAPFGSIGDCTPDTFCGACELLIRLLRERYPDAEIVFATPIQCSLAAAPSQHNHRMFSEYADVIRKTCEHHSVPVLDLYRMSGIDPFIPEQKEKLIPDGLHPNDAGHEKIAARMLPFLLQL